MLFSFTIARIRKIPIEIDISWFFIFALVTYDLVQRILPAGFSGFAFPVYLLLGILVSLLFFACLLLHELAHSLVARKNQIEVKSITLFLFGGVSQLKDEPQNPKAEFKMAIAGPLTSYFLALLFWLFQSLLPDKGFWAPLSGGFYFLAVINFVLATFNLLPAYPLDGGRVLRAALWHFFKEPRTATRIATFLGKAFGIFMMGLGFLTLFLAFKAGEEFYFSGFWLAILGWFLYQAAANSQKYYLIKKLLSGERVCDLMNPAPVTVSPRENVEQLIENYFLRHSFNAYPVTTPEETLGIVSLAQAKNVPPEKRKTTLIAEIMTPLSERFTAKPEEELWAAIPKLKESPGGKLLVIKDNQLLGILSKTDLSRFLEIRSELS